LQFVARELIAGKPSNEPVVENKQTLKGKELANVSTNQETDVKKNQTTAAEINVKEDEQDKQKGQNRTAAVENTLPSINELPGTQNKSELWNVQTN